MTHTVFYCTAMVAKTSSVCHTKQLKCARRLFYKSSFKLVFPSLYLVRQVKGVKIGHFSQMSCIQTFVGHDRTKVSLSFIYTFVYAIVCTYVLRGVKPNLHYLYTPYRDGNSSNFFFENMRNIKKFSTFYIVTFRFCPLICCLETLKCNAAKFILLKIYIYLAVINIYLSIVDL